MDLGPCVAAMRERLPADTIICNGAGNYSGWWHRYWHYAGPVCQLAPTAGAMGYGVPAATAAALRHKDRQAVALAGEERKSNRMNSSHQSPPRLPSSV